jgi:hypothetical protein
VTADGYATAIAGVGVLGLILTTVLALGLALIGVGIGYIAVDLVVGGLTDSWSSMVGGLLLMLSGLGFGVGIVYLATRMALEVW